MNRTSWCAMRCAFVLSIGACGQGPEPVDRAADATPPAATQPPLTIAIIGTGSVGSALGPRFAALGHTVIYGSREPTRESVRTLVAKTGPKAAAATPADAAARAEVVVLAVPADALEQVTKSLGDLTRKIIADPTTGAMRPGADGYLELVPAHPTANASRCGHRRLVW